MRQGSESKITDLAQILQDLHVRDALSGHSSRTKLVQAWRSASGRKSEGSTHDSYAVCHSPLQRESAAPIEDTSDNSTSQPLQYLEDSPADTGRGKIRELKVTHSVTAMYDCAKDASGFNPLADY